MKDKELIALGVAQLAASLLAVFVVVTMWESARTRERTACYAAVDATLPYPRLYAELGRCNAMRTRLDRLVVWVETGESIP